MKRLNVWKRSSPNAKSTEQKDAARDDKLASKHDKGSCIRQNHGCSRALFANMLDFADPSQDRPKGGKVTNRGNACADRHTLFAANGTKLPKRNHACAKEGHIEKSAQRKHAPILTPTSPHVGHAPHDKFNKISVSSFDRVAFCSARVAYADATFAERKATFSHQPRPTKGMLVAITVMNNTFASSGKLAM